MRWLAAALAVAAFGGCTFGVATCRTNADCSGGAICELGSGICMSVASDGGLIIPGTGGGGAVGGGAGGGFVGGIGGGFEGVGGGAAGGGGGGGGGGTSTTADAGPAAIVTLLVPPAPSRPAAGGATYDDSPKAWRRNESVFVAVQSTRPLTSTRITLSANSSAQPAAASSCTLPCAGHCECFRVDLWSAPLAAMRGSFTLTASGVDPGGRTVSATAPILVTRFSWSRPVVSGHQIRATPAIGSDGTIYVGTTAGPALRVGSLVAIAPTGLERWSKPLGRIDASPALSAPGASQRIYVGAVEALGGRLYALSPAGTQLALCPLSPLAGIEASPVILPGDGAAFYSNGTRALISMTPGTATCISKATQTDLPWPGNLVADGDAVHFADTQPRLRRFVLEKDDEKREWKERTMGQWPAVLPATFVNRSLAQWSSTKVIGAGTTLAGGTLFQATVGNSVQFDYGVPAAPASTVHQSPIVGSGGVAFAGVSTGLAAVASTGSSTGAGDPLRNAPVLGQGGRIFALAENGSISEWSSASPPVRAWTAALDTGFDASPTLDCGRDANGAAIAGAPGILYAASRSGTLTAVIVDARGIDTTAAWPKYQKDPRNSGNAATSLAEFSCP